MKRRDLFKAIGAFLFGAGATKATGATVSNVHLKLDTTKLEAL